MTVPVVAAKNHWRRLRDRSAFTSATNWCRRRDRLFGLQRYRLGGAGIAPSVGNVGDSYDNALAETLIGLFKTEVIRRLGSWRSLEAVEIATLDWVDWLNHCRLLQPIGNIPPAEAEERYYAELEPRAVAV